MTPSATRLPTNRATRGTLDREGADCLERSTIGDHGRRLGMVVGWRDLDDVHPRQLDSSDDAADGAEELSAQEPARLRRARPRSEPRIHDVDVDAEVDRIGSVEGFGDGVIDHGFGAAFLHL